MRESAQKLIETRAFQLFIVGVILLNSVVIGIQTTPYAAQYDTILTGIDLFCLVVYTIEAILKIYALHLSYYKDGWNIFDFIVLVLCYIPENALPIPAAVARMVRIFRVVRVFRLVSAFKQIRVIIEGLLRSLSGVVWTGILLMILYYIFAVIGVHMFGKDFPDWFGTLGESMYTLFQVMTLESWSMGISRPVMEVYPYAWLYFVPFVILSAFVVVNVVVGIIIGAIEDARARLQEEEEEAESDQTPEAQLQAEIAKLRQQMEKVEGLLARCRKDG